MFNENSAIVSTWVKLVRNGTYALDQVPTLFNLKEVVASVLSVEA